MDSEQNPGKREGTAGDTGERITREELMAKTSELIRILHKRTTATRFKGRRDDRARLSFARATVAAITAYAAILKDQEIDELVKRIEKLEGKHGTK